MNDLAEYFKTSGTRLGVFYPTHYLIAIFRDPAVAESTAHKLWNAGFPPSDAVAADGKDVLEFDKEQTHLGALLMQAISRFSGTEQIFVDHDLEDARQGAGFLAAHCPTDDLKDTAWKLIGPEGPLDARFYSPRGIEHLAGDLVTD